MTVGYDHACGLTAQGVAYCWGSDSDGQLGDGGGSLDSSSPVAVDTATITGEKSFIQLTAGYYHTCGLTSQGVAYCWGLDADGQLGDGGASASSPSPVAVETTAITGAKSFVQLTAGVSHTCGLTAEGAAYCWGNYQYGRLGAGSLSADVQSPLAVDTTPITGGKGFVQLTAGDIHTCGLTAQGVAYCWGGDTSGLLGNGPAQGSSAVPIAVDTSTVSGGKSFVQLVASLQHTCGLTAEGVPYCWGSDAGGCLGNGDTWQDSESPGAVDLTQIGPQSFVQLVAGDIHTCGLTAEGVVFCWGGDGRGQLGDGGGIIDVGSPVAVDTGDIAGEKAFVHISAGGLANCGVTGEGAAYCWGCNESGQLGVGSISTDSRLPTGLDTGPVSSWKVFDHLAAGDQHSCCVTSEGQAACWGNSGDGQLGNGGARFTSQSPLMVDTASMSGEKAFIRVTGGGFHTCGITSQGVAYCWGNDQWAQLGDGGTTTNSHVPSPVDTSLIAGETAFIRVTGGNFHTCGLTADGAAYCWGADGIGGLGDGPGSPDRCPTSDCALSPAAVDISPIAGEKAFIGLAAGGSHSCGLTSDGLAYCWGSDNSGELGDGGSSVSSDSPVAVDTTTISGEKVFTRLTTGYNHSCGLTADGLAYCWGSDGNHQLGNPGPAANSQSPVAVDTTGIAGERAFVQLAAGYHHTCGLTAEGLAYCWGRDEYGQLGNGSAAGDSAIPQAVDTSAMTGGKTFVKLSTGQYHTCGLTARGAVYCWGLDEDGQLGDGGTSSDSPVPAAGEYCLPCQADGDCGDGLTCTAEGCNLSDGEEQIVTSNDALAVTAPGGWTADYANASANDPGTGADVIYSPDAATPLETSLATQGSSLPYVVWVAHSRILVQNGSACSPTLAVDIDGVPVGSSQVSVDDDFKWTRMGAVALAPGPHSLNFTCAGTCPTRRCALDGVMITTRSVDPGSNPAFVPYLTAAWDDPGLDLHLGKCAYTADAAPCDDGLFCNGQEICMPFLGCVSGTAPCGILPCNETDDSCSGCTSDVECPSCWYCDVDTCRFQNPAEDRKNECPPDDCHPSGCDGLGQCLREPEGQGCMDDGLYCTGAEACDAAGNCMGAGNPCPGTECKHCNEDDDSCFDPAGTSCPDDGLFCTGIETCDGLGNCVGSGNPCGTGICDDVNDTCSCSVTADCPICQWCNAGTCENQVAGEDQKDDCLPDDCHPGDCDGLGQCLREPEGASCTDDGLFCTGSEQCDGAGNCVGTGNPCITPPICDEGHDTCVDCLDDAHCPPCMWCNAGACENQPEGRDYKDDCDDGQYCTGAEVCDGAGKCMSIGSPCPEEECWYCNEDDDRCLELVGQLCKMTNQGLVEECHLCDGAGYCLADGIAEDGMVCKDSVYSCDGKCLSAFCAVEVECDREECEGLPVKEYPQDEGHCRISARAVAVGVTVEPAATGEGGFVPVRVKLANQWELGHSLRSLRVALRLNQPAGAGPEPETRVAYVKRSALLNGGEYRLEEEYLEDGRTVLLVIGEELDAPLTMDLMLLLRPGPAELARFEVDVWAPCESEPYEPGCHDGHSDHRDASWPGMQLQRVSKTVRMDPCGGAYEVESDRRIGMLRSPVLGCQCATTDETGLAWLLWLLIIPGVRRRAT